MKVRIKRTRGKELGDRGLRDRSIRRKYVQTNISAIARVAITRAFLLFSARINSSADASHLRAAVLIFQRITERINRNQLETNWAIKVLFRSDLMAELAKSILNAAEK